MPPIVIRPSFQTQIVLTSRGVQTGIYPLVWESIFAPAMLWLELKRKSRSKGYSSGFQNLG